MLRIRESTAVTDSEYNAIVEAAGIGPPIRSDTARGRRNMGTMRTKAGKTAGKAPRIRRNGATSGSRLGEVSGVFKHVGDPVCLGILFALEAGAGDGAEIGAAIALNQADIIYHLALLRHLGLISPKSAGSQDLYSLTDRGRRVVGLAQSLVHDDQRGDEAPEIDSIDPALLADVGGFVDDPVAWFLTRNPEFLWRRPIELLGTPDEQTLRDRIEAAKYGLFS